MECPGKIGTKKVSLLQANAIVFQKETEMVHCSSYCPIETLVSFLKYFSPSRVRLTMDCCHCMACTNVFRYDALHKEEIEKGKIGYTCTYCGDCLSACKYRAIEYHFPGLRPACRVSMDCRNGRITYLFLDDRTDLSCILVYPLYRYRPYSGHRRGFAGQTAYSRSSIYLSNEDTPYAISGQR